ncbi:hypothetical protein B7G54_14525 [Burkholderia puraquae]|uniref:Uncharacterized protein n=1 Tax=Burkholderia puraquae TaxID=1904757 RepID=A0A1X1PHI7_9BURK|nr:hypothetical protein [Burkholderia puraquae]ORT85772.1 hypothetical protein B7G54_14525 [Burkholderia puraquae]
MSKVLTGIALLPAVIAVVGIRRAHDVGMALALDNTAHFAALAGCAVIAIAAEWIVLSHASRSRERAQGRDSRAARDASDLIGLAASVTCVRSLPLSSALSPRFQCR